MCTWRSPNLFYFPSFTEPFSGESLTLLQQFSIEKDQVEFQQWSNHTLWITNSFYITFIKAEKTRTYNSQWHRNTINLMRFNTLLAFSESKSIWCITGLLSRQMPCGEIRVETEGPKKAGCIMSHLMWRCGVGLGQRTRQSQQALPEKSPGRSMVLFRQGWSSLGAASKYAVCTWRFLTVNLPSDKEPSTAA